MSESSTLLPEAKKEYGTLKNYVNGEWTDSDSGDLLDVRNPASDGIIARVPMSTEYEVKAAIESAVTAFKEWRDTTPVDRVRYLFDLKNELEDNFEELSKIIVQEEGKAIDEARGEIRRTIENVEVATGITNLMQGYNLENVARGIDEECIRQPVGVFCMVPPFNFPAMIPFFFLPYAVACGNTYILKPSEQVPVTQNRIFELIDDVGFPPGVLNLVNGAKDVVDVLLDSPDVRGVSFVGSTPVGKYIYTRATTNLKRAQCQCGAKNFILIMPDVNVDAIVPSLLTSLFGCAGERCLAGSVLLAHKDVHENLRDTFVSKASKIKVGYGLDESVQMGPVISASHRDRVLDYIENGVEQGAKLLLDGRGVTVEGYENGYFIGPTVFDDVRPDMGIANEEIFGPVASIIKVDGFEEALEIIDRNPFGNAASIYTSNGGLAREFKHRTGCGNIGINIGVVAPMSFFAFGGYKESFFGDIHGQVDSIDFFTERKIVISRWY